MASPAPSWSLKRSEMLWHQAQCAGECGIGAAGDSLGPAHLCEDCFDVITDDVKIKSRSTKGWEDGRWRLGTLSLFTGLLLRHPCSCACLCGGACPLHASVYNLHLRACAHVCIPTQVLCAHLYTRVPDHVGMCVCLPNSAVLSFGLEQWEALRLEILLAGLCLSLFRLLGYAHRIGVFRK